MTLLKRFGLAHTSLQLNKQSLACIKDDTRKTHNKTELNLHQTIQEYNTQRLKTLKAKLF